MKSTSRILINGIILISMFSCEGQTKELKAEYIIGKWTHYGGTTTENGITEIDSLIFYSGPIQYEFKENGIVSVGFGDKENLEWKISDKNELSMGFKEQFAIYTLRIESDSTLILSRTFNNKIFSYHLRKGW